MAKLKNVSQVELLQLCDSLDTPHITMQDVLGRIEKGYVDRIEDPDELAKYFVLLAREASAIAAQILMIARMQRQRDEMEKLRKEGRGE